MTQKESLKVYLSEKGSITQLDAFIALGICRLSERIRELEAEGLDIAHQYIAVPTRNGTTHVTQYSLIK